MILRSGEDVVKEVSCCFHISTASTINRKEATWDLFENDKEVSSVEKSERSGVVGQRVPSCEWCVIK